MVSHHQPTPWYHNVATKRSLHCFCWDNGNGGTLSTTNLVVFKYLNICFSFPRRIWQRKKVIFVSGEPESLASYFRDLCIKSKFWYCELLQNKWFSSFKVTGENFRYLDLSVISDLTVHQISCSLFWLRHNPLGRSVDWWLSWACQRLGWLLWCLRFSCQCPSC